MLKHKVVSRDEWIEARKNLLAKEKEFTRLRDQLNRERRDLPWVRVEKQYIFDGPNGKETLGQLFDGASQLLVYHFMFDPSWSEGCKHCSFWADNYEGVSVHLKHRDVALVAISRAPLAKIEAFRKRMGWRFKWVSSSGNDFNFDYHVSHSPAEIASGEIEINYRPEKSTTTENPGLSAFYKDTDGTVFHTYSCYERGLDMVNGAYHMLDLVAKGRDEEGLPFPQAWVRHHDKYD